MFCKNISLRFFLIWWFFIIPLFFSIYFLFLRYFPLRLCAFALIAAVFWEEQASPVPHIQELFLQTDQEIIHKKSILKQGYVTLCD